MATEQKKMPLSKEDSLMEARRTAVATARNKAEAAPQPSLLALLLEDDPSELSNKARRLTRRAPCKTLGAILIGAGAQTLSLTMSLKVAPQIFPFAYTRDCSAALAGYLETPPSTCEDGDDILRTALPKKEIAFNVTASLFLFIVFIGSRWTHPKISKDYKKHSALVGLLFLIWAFLFYTLPTGIEILGTATAEADACQAVLTNSTALACTRHTSSTFSSKSNFFAAYLLPTYSVATAAIFLIRSWCLQCSLPEAETETLLPMTHSSGSGGGAAASGTGAAKSAKSAYYGT